MKLPQSRAHRILAAISLAFAPFVAAAPTPTPPPDKAPATAIRWKPEADMDNQLYPSLIIATANRRPGADDDKPSPDLLGDHYGLLGISVRATQPGVRIKVTIRENEVLNASTWSGTLPKGEHTYYISPPIAYKYDALRHVRQQRPLSVQFDVEINSQPAGTQAETVMLRSVNDCPYAIKPSETTLDETANQKPGGNDPGQKDPGMHGASDSAVGWMFAAFVNEDHPIIDAMLNEALHTGLITNVDGYQDGKPEEVLRQAFAVWKVLQDRGIRYSDVSTTPGVNEKVSSQYVRFVDESLKHQQANCVDGSVLFASVLRKMGLAPFLAVVPHHMYIGVALSPEDDDDTVACIETTLLGADEVDNSLKEPPALAKLDRSLDGTAHASPAWRTFKTAVSLATATFYRDRAKFEDDTNSNYQIIDVADARRDGIMPIPFDRTDAPVELPGGPPLSADKVPSNKPLPTPFVRPSPDDTPLPRATPASSPTSPPARTPTPPGHTPGRSAWDAVNAPDNGTPAPTATTRPNKPLPHHTPGPSPTDRPHPSPGKDEYDGFFH